MVSYVDVDFLQLFLWETFRAMPFEFKLAKVRIVDGVEKVKSSLLKSRRLRWQMITWPEASRNLWQIIDEEGSYNFRPYAYTPRGVVPLDYAS